MNGGRASDRSIVPKNSPNNGGPGRTPAEEREGRDLAKGKSGPAKQAIRTLSRAGLSHALERIRSAARRDKELKFTALWHHVYDVEHLRTSYYALKRDAAAGVDGQTWEQYGERLEENLKDLSGRLARGAYRAQPVRRVYIPKGDGRERPIGVPVLEDKLVQRTAAAVLGAIYEEMFKEFSYGFRPGRGAHEALDALAVGIQSRPVNWILDADIRGFFDTLSHEWIVKMVEDRIGDRRVVRHIQKWLNAGVLEDGKRVAPEEGTPQGGSISPLLANLYLHYVLDRWTETWMDTQARGAMVIVRYADDFVVGFQHQDDAERYLAALHVRFAEFNLTLHAEKTRIIEFGRYAAERRERRGDGKPPTFDFLGFTHICGKTRAGWFTVLRHTMAKRLRAKLKTLAGELRRRMHHAVTDVGPWLRSVVMGHNRYYGVPFNYRAMSSFRHALVRLWRRVLNRRSDKAAVSCLKMERIADQWLPRPRICQPYPQERFRVMTQGKSPVR